MKFQAFNQVVDEDGIVRCLINNGLRDMELYTVLLEIVLILFVPCSFKCNKYSHIQLILVAFLF